MATVWSVTNIFTERDCAVKILLPQVAKSKEAVDRFMQEAKVSARVDHPNIVNVLDVGQTDEGNPFLVIELLTGVTLETALRRQSPPMTTSELLYVMVEVARALGAAHRAGVIHRDLKPTNIFLHKERDGRAVPKVLDFGVSKFLEEERGRVHALTVAGTVLGSPMYMSPEQARGELKVDGRTDIFSFGAILFEAVCGFRAYEAPNFNALIVKIATTSPRDINEEAPHVPAALRALIKRCLEPSAAARIGSFDEVADALMDALPELESHPISLPPPLSGALNADPEATNAMPVVKASDRPPASMPPPPPAPGSPSAGTPVVATVSAAVPSKAAWQNPLVWLVASGVALGVVSLALLVVFAMQKMGNENEPHTPASEVALPVPTAQPPAVVPAVTPTPAAAPTQSAPISVSIDTLPIAPSRPAGKGVLAVGSRPSACTLSVDGVVKGQTPIPGLELSPGTHQLSCTTNRGKRQEATVRILEGASGRHVFTF